MILDLLISRYLDSELTEEEDRELRSITSADPEAREAFDQAVLLHIAMRCEDPEIDVPADLVQDTRSLVLDKIDALPAPQHIAPKSMARRARAVAALVALLLILALPIDELTREYGAQTAYLQQGRTELQNENTRPMNEQRTRRIHGNQRIVEYGAVAAPRASSVTQPTPQPILATLSPDSFHGQAILDVAQALARPRVAPSVAHPSVVRASAALPSVAQSSPRVAPGETNAPAQSEDVPLLLTTFYTSSVQGSLETVSAITQISQSIGYGLSDRSFVGLEVGAMQYTVDRVMHTTVRTDGESDVAMRETVVRSSTTSGGKLSPTSTPAGTFTQISTRIVDQQSVAWGAAFYQRPIVHAGAMAMLGRVGVGAGMDGMLAYGRLQAEYRVLPILSVTMGAEARYAPMRTGAVSGQQSGQSYGGFLSMVYGIQLSL
ncbi:hypothetical protein BH10BAC6_BH10BAC6_05470 [soil metagenome]